MDFEPSEHEPDEHDPEADLRDPESDSLTIPSVSTGETDVPPEVLKSFWAIVLVVNAAVLAASLGVLFLVFESDLRRGGVLLVGGLVLFGLAVRRYRRVDLDADAPEANRSPDPDGDAIETNSATEPEERSPDPDDSNPTHEDRT